MFADFVSLLMDVNDPLLPLMRTTKKSDEMHDLLPLWASDWSVKPPDQELVRLEPALLYNASRVEKDEDGSPTRADGLSYRLRFRTN
jgi:hypothetical protein